jgi:tripartite-type tricarboxylate transporter receptor subunit TctC
MTGLSVHWETVHAQANFYEGKTIRLIVGFTAGGGYDAYTRTIGRHMGKHIPGNPVMIVENMPGAGSMISANYTFKAAKPDGLTIGHFIGGLFLQQLLGKPGIEFDAAKFQYVGVPGQDNFVIGVAKSAGITDVESWVAPSKSSNSAVSLPAPARTIFPTCSRRHLDYLSNSSPATKAPPTCAWRLTAAKSPA